MTLRLMGVFWEHVCVGRVITREQEGNERGQTHHEGEMDFTYCAMALSFWGDRACFNGIISTWWMTGMQQLVEEREKWERKK